MIIGADNLSHKPTQGITICKGQLRYLGAFNKILRQENQTCWTKNIKGVAAKTTSSK